MKPVDFAFVEEGTTLHLECTLDRLFAEKNNLDADDIFWVGIVSLVYKAFSYAKKTARLHFFFAFSLYRKVQTLSAYRPMWTGELTPPSWIIAQLRWALPILPLWIMGPTNARWCWMECTREYVPSKFLSPVCSIHESIVNLIDWSVDWLIDPLIDRSIDCLIDWLVDWLNYFASLIINVFHSILCLFRSAKKVPGFQLWVRKLSQLGLHVEKVGLLHRAKYCEVHPEIPHRSVSIEWPLFDCPIRTQSSSLIGLRDKNVSFCVVFLQWTRWVWLSEIDIVSWWRLQVRVERIHYEESAHDAVLHAFPHDQWDKFLCQRCLGWESDTSSRW